VSTFALDWTIAVLSDQSRNPTVATIAKRLGMSRRTACARALRMGSLPPATLIGWARLLVAAYELDRWQMSLEAVAGMTGFATGAALRHMHCRYVGRPMRRGAEGSCVGVILESLRLAVAGKN
jgi:transcriptional regulator GlxA family with amidase domain